MILFKGVTLDAHCITFGLSYFLDKLLLLILLINWEISVCLSVFLTKGHLFEFPLGG